MRRPTTTWGLPGESRDGWTRRPPAPARRCSSSPAAPTPTATWAILFGSRDGWTRRSPAIARQLASSKPGCARPTKIWALPFTIQGRPDEATCHRQGLLLKPDDADGHYNQSLAFLLKGDFEQGWPEYEWQLSRIQGHQPRPFGQPRHPGRFAVGGTHPAAARRARSR